ncbi:uncharacterized protein LOC143294210 [Babylonia areolata]|uniref:uncharacterized protein LOC143294210 n=1 Tax=Babylonia areolata TaxID=304850 RepID=UPI003FD0F49F
MRLPPWSLLLLLILCPVWAPDPSQPTFSRLDTAVTPHSKGLDGRQERDGDGGTGWGEHRGDRDSVCPSQCRLQGGKAVLGCADAELLDLVQLAGCALSLPTLRVVELISRHFPCNCTLVQFVALTSSAQIVTSISTPGCSPSLLSHCDHVVRTSKVGKRGPHVLQWAALRKHGMVGGSPFLALSLDHLSPAPAVSSIVVSMWRQQQKLVHFV